MRAVLAEFYDGYDPDEVMSYAEAAAMLGMTVQAVRRLVYTGSLTPVGRQRWARVLGSAVRFLLLHQR